ncbi:hypothetical protein [Rhodococcus sp. WAY2]|uniref:hypothetical protein n=1 Tax=Rhodococcus sp. WAY2 TaxID=2663121 RepID=UPI0013202C8B|nr:hypothetical protein [Rhodococcus sp. WAY2]QHE73460.1 hypothetical protein GFS60_07120 [Rhodococcus sp. WAY2]
MSQFSWIDDPVSPELGAIAHGPLLLSDSNGYRVGIRYLIAYRNVMDMTLAVSATGSKSAELARQFRATYGTGRLSAAKPEDGFSTWVVSPELNIHTERSSQNPHTMEGHYVREFSYVINGRPTGTFLEIEYRWPAIGLDRTRVVLEIPPAHALDEAIVPI